MKRKISLLILILGYLIVIVPSIQATDSFVHFTEVTEKGAQIPLSSEQSYYNVDINSYIDVDFTPQVWLEKQHRLNTPESIQLQKELTSVNQLLEEAEKHLSKYVSEIETIRPQLLENSDPELEDQFLQALKAHGRLIMAILTYLEPVVGLEALDQALSTSDPTYADLLQLLSKRIQTIEEQLRKEANTLVNESQFSLRVWCIQKSPGKNATGIHLPNYDDLARGSFQVVDKVTFVMSEEEREQLLKNAQLYQNIQSNLQKIGQQGVSIQQVEADLRKQLALELTKVNQTLPTSEVTNLLTKVEEQIGQTPTTNKTLEALEKDVAELSSKVVSAREEYQTLLDSFHQLTTTMQGGMLFIQPGEVLSQIDQCSRLTQQFRSQVVQKDLSQISKLTDNLQQYLKAEESELSTEVREELKALTGSLLTNWTSSMAQFDQNLKQLKLTDYSSSFQGLVERWSFISNLAGQNHATEELLPENLREQSLLKAPKTRIEIPWTKRQEDDLYVLAVQVHNQKSVVYDQEYIFRIKFYGLSSRWMTNLAFIKEPTELAFHPVTTVSWVLHYQRRSGIQSGGWRDDLADALTPGLGISSVVYAEDKQIQYGLGVTMTVLDDLIQVGYGYQLLQNEGGRKDFFFIGTSLFNLFNPSSTTKR